MSSLNLGHFRFMLFEFLRRAVGLDLMATVKSDENGFQLIIHQCNLNGNSYVNQTCYSTDFEEVTGKYGPSLKIKHY